MQLARNRLLLSLILASIVAFSGVSARAGTTLTVRKTGTPTASHVLKPGSTTFSGEPDGGTPHPVLAPKQLVPVPGGEGGSTRVPQWFMWIGRDWIMRLLGVS